MVKKVKILIFGGSFDPPHLQHITILKDAIEKIMPTKTIIVPTYLSPFKKRHLFSYLERKWMIKKLIKKEKINAQICDFEYKQRKKTYTWMLVKEIKLKYKNGELYFLIGSDSANQLDKWKKFNFLAKNLIFVIAKRKDHKLRIPKKIKKIILKKTYPNISSTKIRQEIFSGNFKNIPPSIRKYIDRKLKILSSIKKVKAMLNPARFNHTIEVVKMAVKLAWLYGEDLKKTFLSALLHDIAKNIDLKKQIEIIRKEKIKVKNLSYIAEKHPEILHQWASMVIAKRDFKVKDKKILNAISRHTTACDKMSKLDMIVYVSDFISYDRKFRGVKLLRKIAQKDLEKAFKMIYKMKREYVKKTQGEVYEVN